MSSSNTQVRGTRAILAVTVEQSLDLLGQIPAELRNRGVEVHIVFSPKRWSGFKSYEKEGLIFHELKMSRSIHPLVDLLSFFFWLRLVGKVKPDIVAGGTPKAALLSMLSGRIWRVPSRIYVLRGLRMETEIGAMRALLIGVERLTSFLSSEVLSVSHSLRDKYIAEKLAGRRRVTVLGFGSSKGVDTEFFKPLKAGKTGTLAVPALQSRPIVVGYAGRITPDKGALDLLAALDILWELGHDTRAIFIGQLENPAYSEAFLERISKSTHSSFLGDVRDTREFYSRVDLLCLPTRREGFPNVVLEAASFALPTITTSATGAIDSVVDGVTGIIVAPESPEDLARAILFFICNPNQLVVMGSRARQRACKYFASDLVTSRTCDFLLRRQAEK